MVAIYKHGGKRIFGFRYHLDREHLKWKENPYCEANVKVVENVGYAFWKVVREGQKANEKEFISRTPQLPSKAHYQKNQTKFNPVCTEFQAYFPAREQEMRQCIQWRVVSGPMRRFLSWLNGRHQFPFPASKFRVLLAIWFGFLIAKTQ